MTTKKQVIANKKNAQKWWVKTQEWKQKIKLNAVKHWITSSLYNRDLEQQIIEEYQITGTLEKMMVQHTCISRARYERGICLENKLIMHIVSPPKYEKVYNSKEQWEKYKAYNKNLADGLVNSPLLNIEPGYKEELVEWEEFWFDMEKIEYLVSIIGKYNHQNEVQLNKNLRWLLEYALQKQ